MKTKNLLVFPLFILCVICSINVYSSVNSLSPENAESKMKHIHLTGRLSGRIQKTAIPTASLVEAYIVDNLITINFTTLMLNEPLRVTIKDTSENIVFEQVFTVNGSEAIKFSLDIINDEIYLLEIFGDKGYLYGEF